MTTPGSTYFSFAHCITLAFECDDVTRRAHVSRKRRHREVADGWFRNPSAFLSRFSTGFPDFHFGTYPCGSSQCFSQTGATIGYPVALPQYPVALPHG